MNNSNDLQRISMLTCLAMSPDYDLTIENAALDLNLPIHVVRDYMAVFAGFFGCITDCDASSKEIVANIKKGKYDKTIIRMDKNETWDEDYLIFATNLEHPYVNGWFGNDNTLYHIKSFYKKDEKKFGKLFPLLEEAVALGQAIVYDYEENGLFYKEQKSRPLLLRISPEDIGNAKCVCTDGRVLNVIDMANVKYTNDYEEVTNENQPDWNLVWGCTYDNEERKFHVVLEIHENTRNIIRKVKADTANRVFGKLEKQEERLYRYEDDVIGKNEFKEWIRGYGSSVKVIEPEWLKEEILNDNRLIQRQYETGCFCQS